MIAPSAPSGRPAANAPMRVAVSARGKALAALTCAALLAGCGTMADFPPEPDASPERGTLYVTNKHGNNLSVIDLSSGREMRRIATCTEPHELALSPDGDHVAVACYGGTAIEIYATAGMERVARFDLGAGAAPHGLAWHHGHALFATAEGRRSIFRITGALTDTPEVREYPTKQAGSHMLVVADDAAAAWTTDLGSRTVTRIELEGATRPRSVTVGEEPEGIALSPDGKTLWVSARGSDQAIALDPVTLKVRETVATGRFPLRLAIRPQGDVAITSNLRDGSLSVIDLDTAQVVRTIAVSSPEEAEERFQVTVLWSDEGSTIYVAETGTDTVAEVDYATGTVRRRIAVGDGGDGLAVRQ